MKCRKRAFVSFEAALAAAKAGMEYAQAKGLHSRLKPYRCPDCQQLHVAHADQAILRGSRR